MTAEESIQPINVAGATLLVQVLFLAILGTAERLYRARRAAIGPDASDFTYPRPRRLETTSITFLALASFSLLLLSDDLYGIWSPLFQGLGISTIRASTAILLVYILNLGAVAFLVFESGGSESSPFVSALFTLPALAIFLRMPPWAFIAIAFIAAAIYLLLLIPDLARRHPNQLLRAPGLSPERPSQLPSAFMNIACLALAMLTGYVTRPVPITEMKPANLSIATPSASSSASSSK